MAVVKRVKLIRNPCGGIPRHRALLGLLLLAMCGGTMFGQGAPPLVVVNWAKKTPNHATPTLQAVVNPMLRRGSPIHDAAFAALHGLGCDYVRYAFWFPYPRLAVAELRPPDQN